MSLLARFSIRTILNAVFLILASALCVVLALQIASAWHEVGSAQRIEALATADRDVFQAMTTMPPTTTRISEDTPRPLA